MFVLRFSQGFFCSRNAYGSSDLLSLLVFSIVLTQRPMIHKHLLDATAHDLSARRLVICKGNGATVAQL
eukprot:5258635-Pleurochrysis_carterae.AAC.2